MTTLQEVHAAARELSPDERELLAVQLLADLESEQDPGYEQGWSDEIRSRLDDIDSGRVQMVPGDEVMAKLRAKIDAHPD